MRSPLALIILALLLIILAEGVIYFRKTLTKPVTILDSAPHSLLQEHADKIIQTCAKSNYHPSCYDREIPKLMDFISMPDAFKVTKIIQQKDQSYFYCHVLGHKLSAREVDKDPSRWKEAVSMCPSGMCSNGCIHGGFQQRFRADSLNDEQIQQIKPDLASICERRPSWQPTGLEQSSCYHALGHLTMYLTRADTTKSLALCDELALKSDARDFTQVCYDGVFMQIFQPLEPEDFALIKGKQPDKAETLAFCQKYPIKAEASCLNERWPLFKDEIITPSGLINFCSAQQKSNQDRCYMAMFYVLTPKLNFDVNKINDFCSQLPAPQLNLCYSNAASRLIETDYSNASKAAQLCSLAKDGSANSKCFETLVLYSSYNYHLGSSEHLSLCEVLSEPWKSSCLKQVRDR